MKQIVFLLTIFLLLVSTASAATISGNITDTFKKPIEGVAVSLFYPTPEKFITKGTTDAKGAYEIEYEGPNDIYLLKIEAQNYHQISKKIFLNNSKNHGFDFELSKIIMGTMSFFITDQKNIPLEGTITLLDEAEKTVAMTDFTLGKGSVTNLQLGKYKILVKAGGFKEYSQQIEMSLSDLNKKYIIHLIDEPQTAALAPIEEPKEAEVSAMYYDYIRPQFSNGKASFEWELYRITLIPYEEIEYKIRLSKIEEEKRQTILIMPGKILVNTTLGKKTFFDLNNDRENDMSITVNQVYKKAFPSGFIDSFVNVTLSILKEEAKAMNATNEIFNLTQNQTANKTVDKAKEEVKEEETDKTKNETIQQAAAQKKDTTIQSSEISLELKEGKGIIFVTGQTTTENTIKKEAAGLAIAIILIGLFIYLIIIHKNKEEY